MSNNKQIAADLIREASVKVFKERPDTHGDTEGSFQMIGDLWAVYLRHCRLTRSNDAIHPRDVAEMMTMVKKARKVYGNETNRDHHVDDVGYAALAGMLSLSEPEKEPTNE